MKYILLITTLYLIYLFLTDISIMMNWWDPLGFSKRFRYRKIREKIRNLVNEQGGTDYYCYRIDSPVPIGNSGNIIVFGTVKITKEPPGDEKYPDTWAFSYTLDKQGTVIEGSPELKILSKLYGL